MNKVSKLRKIINPEIKEGDTIRVRDFSYLSSVETGEEVFDLYKQGKTTIGEVVETNINDIVVRSITGKSIILLDCIVMIKGKQYHACSQFLEVISTPKSYQDIRQEYVEEQGYDSWAHFCEHRIPSPVIYAAIAERYAEHRVLESKFK